MEIDKNDGNLRQHDRGIAWFMERYWQIMLNFAFVLSASLASVSVAVLHFDLVSVVLIGAGLVLILVLVAVWFITFLLGCLGFFAAEVKVVKEIDSRYNVPLQKVLGKPDEYHKVWGKKRAEMRYSAPAALKRFNTTIVAITLVVNLLSIAYSFMTLYKAPPPFYIVYPPQLLSAIIAILVLFLKKKSDKRIAG